MSTYFLTLQSPSDSDPPRQTIAYYALSTNRSDVLARDVESVQHFDLPEQATELMEDIVASIAAYRPEEDAR